MAKTTRRVLVLMMNSKQHFEAIEVRVPVQALLVGFFCDEQFEADLEEAEDEARKLMKFSGMKDIDDYQCVGIQCAVTSGINAGRIVWVRQVEMAVERRWR